MNAIKGSKCCICGCRGVSNDWDNGNANLAMDTILPMAGQVKEVPCNSGTFSNAILNMTNGRCTNCSSLALLRMAANNSNRF